jgi:hypothetical protein
MSAASDVPEPVRQIVSRIVDTALARCDRASVPYEDFFAALEAEMRLHPGRLLERVVARTFARLRAERS